MDQNLNETSPKLGLQGKHAGLLPAPISMVWEQAATQHMKDGEGGV